MAEQRATKEICPECGKRCVVRILYGMPAATAVGAAKRRDLIIGGCVVRAENPHQGCTSCGWRGVVGKSART